MISERMLKKWRREALKGIAALEIGNKSSLVLGPALLNILAKATLKLTQELLDQRLLEQKEKKK